MDEHGKSFKTYGAAITTGQAQCDWTANFRPLRNCAGLQSSVPTGTLPKQYFGQTTIPTSDLDIPILARAGERNHLQLAHGMSESYESAQQHVSPDGHTLSEELSDNESLSLSESELSGPSQRRTRLSSAKARALHGKSGKVTVAKKKVGRPIAYHGDPNCPSLTEGERRRIKRRIANRESARRVRHKRQELMEDLQVKIATLMEQNSNLQSGVVACKTENSDLSDQLRAMTQKYNAVVVSNRSMQSELESLRSSMQVRMMMLEQELDKQESAMPQPVAYDEKSMFASAQAQSPSLPGYTAQPVFLQPHTEFKGSQSFQLDLEYLAGLEGRKTMDLLNNTSQDLALFKTSSSLNPPM